MIIFKEKKFSRPIDRTSVTVTRVLTGMPKRQSMRTVVAAKNNGVKGLVKEVGRYAKGDPYQAYGSLAGKALIPIPLVGPHIGAKAGKGLEYATKRVGSIIKPS